MSTMNYETFKKNLKDAGIRNIELTRSLGLSRQVIAVYHAQGVPVCMQKLSQLIGKLAEKGLDKSTILSCADPVDYNELKKVIKGAGLNNKLFAEHLGYKSQTISNYARQGVPRCVGMLARLLNIDTSRNK